MTLLETCRPQRFQDMWQWPTAPALRAITHEIARGQLQSPLLVTGDLGTGKTSLARIIGRRASCQEWRTHEFEPCNACEGCMHVTPHGATTYSEYGYIEIDSTEHSARAVRQMIMRETRYSMFPSSFSRWVVCLDEVGRCDGSFQKQLLKIVENAKAHIILCSATSNPIDEALKDRCQIRPLPRPTQSQCSEALRRIIAAEHIPIEPSAVPLLIARHGCNPRNILKTLITARSLTEGTIGIEEIEAAVGMTTGLEA